MMTATKVRLRFAKRGDLRLVSHHDLLRCLERTLRRAQIPMAVSQGFNPRPKIVFALALALGIEGRREVVELELAEPLEPAEVLQRLTAVSPPGLDWLDVEAVAPGRSAPQVEAVQYFLEVPVDRQEATRSHWPPCWQARNGRTPGTEPTVTLRSTSGRSCWGRNSIRSASSVSG